MEEGKPRDSLCNSAFAHDGSWIDVRIAGEARAQFRHLAGDARHQHLVRGGHGEFGGESGLFVRDFLRNRPPHCRKLLAGAFITEFGDPTL